MREEPRTESENSRRIARRVGRALLIAALVLQQPVSTAVIVVDGGCSLADAITSANTDSAVGGCTAGVGPDDLRLTQDVTLTAALPTVVSDISIAGGGFTVARDPGAPDFRIFAVIGQPLTLTNLTVSHGVSDKGGGIYANDYAGVYVYDSRLTDNRATLWGGALYLGEHSEGLLVDTTVSGNDGGARGGGAYATDDAVLLISSSTFSGNSASRGGALYTAWDATTTLVGSTLVGNSATRGGGLSTTDFALTTLRNSTVSGNMASEFAGGIYNAFGYGYATLINSTVSGNTNSNIYTGFESGNVRLQNSIVAYPIGGTNCDGYTYFIDNGGNFDDDGSCPGTSPIVAGIDFDTLLAYNGGPTMTHALEPGSVAAGAAGDCGESVDQRGFARADGACDSGAFELGASPFGGAVFEVAPRDATCTNLSTGDSVSAPLDDETWNCGAAGLAIGPGDRVRQSVRGAAITGASARVLGMTPSKLACRNLSTGQSVTVAIGVASWDCVAEGLVVSPGDRVQQTVSGQVP